MDDELVSKYPDVKGLPSPVLLKGEVVRGFGRGSKVLGIPTANLPASALEQLPQDFGTGIYFGWAMVDDKGPFKMVTSVGYNPYFKNETRTVEPHLLHEFPEDFYGAQIRVAITTFLRPEWNFDSVEALIACIKMDIAYADKALDIGPESKGLLQ